jgi:hypothetical protein
MLHRIVYTYSLSRSANNILAGDLYTWGGGMYGKLGT